MKIMPLKRCLTPVFLLLVIAFLALYATGKPEAVREAESEIPIQEEKPESNQDGKKHSTPLILDKPVLLTEYRKKLAREYSLMHYGEPSDTIVPQAIVIHWTASDTWESAYNHFYGEEAVRDREYGLLNPASHFLVDRDGTIYRLTPETSLNRHAIGLNWCSIGIENVGGVNGKQDLTGAQLKSNADLVKYLKSKYPSIKYLLGHYQQDQARKAGLWRENMPGYYAGKADPGPDFMESLIKSTKDLGLIAFQP